MGDINEQLAAGMGERRSIAVIDGNSLMHRAYHAVAATMTAPDGNPTNAVFGFLSMFSKMIELFEPDGVVCAFDKGKPRVRMEMLEQYKAQRKPMDNELRVQFPIIHELLDAMDVPILESEGWEGDDILGTMAVTGEAAGVDILLFTGDRDIYQLATDHVHIVSMKKGMSDVRIVTPEEVLKAYEGVSAKLIPDFYGLKGDSSDNIPGVPGIGPKKAAALITQYGSLEGVLEHADEVKGKMGENLRAHMDDARVSKQVATIRCDAPVSVDFDAVVFPSFDAEKVHEVFAKYALFGAYARLMGVAGAVAESDAQGSSSTRLELPEILEGDAAHKRFEQALDVQETLYCAIDDTREKDALFGGSHYLWVLASDAMLKFDTEAAIQDVLMRAFAHTQVVSVDIKQLIHELVPTDSSMPQLIHPLDVDPARIFDTKVAVYLLEAGVEDFTNAHILETYAGKNVPQDDELSQAYLSCLVARETHEALIEKLHADKSWDCYTNIELPLIPVLVQMERAGMFVEPDRLSELSAELGGEMAQLEQRIQEIAGEPFNVNSPMQLSHILFDVLKLPTAGLKKTARGYYSTNAKKLEELSHDHEIVRLILDYREKAKIKSTYLDTLGGLRMADGRVHTTYNQTVTATGRLSSSNPNLQNIPTRSKLGHTVRTAFSAAQGSVILAVDYSQVELRLLAHLSGDEHLVDAFNSGNDFHAQTAARVFGVEPAEVTPQLRSRAKAVNFGIVYGQQAYGLAQTLDISMGEARDMIDAYFTAYPQVRTYLDTTISQARTSGYAITMFGRKRHIPELAEKNAMRRSFGERTAMNHPMQGSAADIIKLAMIRVAQKLREDGFAARMILQVHDELDFECPLDEVEELTAMVQQVMESVVELKVPLIADASTGETWADAK